MKNFIKNNIAAVVTVLVIFAGGSALAVYSDTGGDTVTQPRTIVVYDKDGNIKLQKDPGNQAVTDNLQYIVPTEQELKAINEKGMNRFKVINGKLTEVIPGQTKSYAVDYDANGNIVGVAQAGDGYTVTTDTGQAIQISDKEYERMEKEGRQNYKVVDGKLAKIEPNAGGKNVLTQTDPNSGKLYAIPPKAQ